MPHFLFLYIGAAFFVLAVISSLGATIPNGRGPSSALVGIFLWGLSVLSGTICAASFFVQAGIMFAGSY